MKFKTMLGILMFLLIICSCAKSGNINNIKDLENKTIGIKKGTVVGDLTLEVIPSARIKYLADLEVMYSDLVRGGVQAIADDEPALRSLAGKKDDVKLLRDLITIDDYGFATAINRPEMIAVVNKVFEELKRNGTFDEIIKRWFPEHGTPEKMPEIRLEPKNGVLRFGTSSVTEPFSYLDRQGQVIGLDIELAHYIAKELGMGLEIIDMPFQSMIPKVIAHKVDVIGGCITITAFRQKHVLFSQSYYRGGVAAMVVK